MNETGFLLEVEKITKSFTHSDDSLIRVLNGVSFRLQPGEKVALTGANGSGKTTLLRIIQGQLQQDSGHIFFLGRPKSSKFPHERAKQIGSVSQNSYKAVASDLTVEEVLAIASRRQDSLRLKKVSSDSFFSELERISPEIAQFVSARRKSVTNTLSGGQRQLVALAAALLGQPRVLLLDEHLSSLDDEYQSWADAAIDKIVALDKAGCVVVSHDKKWINGFSDRVMRIEKGTLHIRKEYS
ncbi:MAG: ATP-binding cassette domain-containing protein [Candidatus Thiodiazotropha sp.]